jgi:hypothetical protein
MDPVVGAHWLTVRAALGLEIKTGMKHSKGSILAMLQKKRITNARAKKQAWTDLNKWMVANGLPEGRQPW